LRLEYLAPDRRRWQSYALPRTPLSRLVRPAQRAVAQRLRALAHSGDDRRRPARPLIGVLRSPPQVDRCEGPREQAEAAGRCTAAPRSRRRWWRSGPNRQDARRPPEEAGEGSGGRPTKSARRCGLCRSPTGFVEAVAFQQVHRGTASAATRWRSEMAGPDSIFAKELNGDNPFLIGDLRVLGDLRVRLVPWA